MEACVHLFVSIAALYGFLVDKQLFELAAYDGGICHSKGLRQAFPRVRSLASRSTAAELQ